MLIKISEKCKQENAKKIQSIQQERGGNSKEREKQEGRREDMKQDDIETKTCTIKIHVNRLNSLLKHQDSQIWSRNKIHLQAGFQNYTYELKVKMLA